MAMTTDDYCGPQQLKQEPLADDLEIYIDSMLDCPVTTHHSCRQLDTSGQVAKVRLPDATIVSVTTSRELEDRYIRAGWKSLVFHYGDTPETEYQVHALLTMKY